MFGDESSSSVRRSALGSNNVDRGTYTVHLDIDKRRKYATVLEFILGVTIVTEADVDMNEEGNVEQRRVHTGRHLAAF